MTTYNAMIRGIPMPERVSRLPVSPDGFPIPAFVAKDDEGKQSDFRVISGEAMNRCVKQKRCWVCGEPLGRALAFVLGPMCALNRTISEPPSHLDCATYSVKACPFLSNPRMRRNDKDLPEGHVEAAGLGLKRNPGAAAVWVTRSYKPFSPPGGGVLFRVGEPENVLWFARGHPATRQEVLDSINSGLPSLIEIAEEEGPDAMKALDRAHEAALKLLPS